MIKVSTASILLALPLFFSFHTGAQENGDALTQLKICARIENSAERMACYDTLGKQVVAEETATQTNTATKAQEAPETTEAAASVATTSNNVSPDKQVSADAAAGAATEDGGTAAVVATASPALSSEIGGKQFENKDGEDIEPDRGRVVSCQLDVNDKYYFSFDNGQVWRQTDSKRYRLKDECQFVVTITKDFFGYKMQIDGEKAKIRIKRVR